MDKKILQIFGIILIIEDEKISILIALVYFLFVSIMESRNLKIIKRKRYRQTIPGNQF